MTGPGRDEEEDSLVIHWDGGFDQAIDAPEPPEPPQRFPWHQRYRYQLFALVFLAGISLAAYGYGEATYNPPSLLPELIFDTSDSFYGTNQTVSAELDMIRESFEIPEALALEATGPVFRVSLPRTVADRLFGERAETFTLFSASSPEGESRFLVAADGGETAVIAIEAPLGLSRRDQPTGVFLALDPDDPALGEVVDAVEAILPNVNKLDAIDVSPGRLYIFGPFQDADAGALEMRIEGNRVTAHLANQIEAAGGDVSLATPAFLLLGAPSRGTINALYHPPRRLVMEPLWGGSATTSLAHELVHAYIDTVVKDESSLRSGAADYFQDSHPVLYGVVVGDLYERLGREGRAEETLAFVTGAIAAQQTKTVETRRLLENQGNLAISEAILFSDVDLLIETGLLPPCMRPSDDERGELTQAYYERLASACES